MYDVIQVILLVIGSIFIIKGIRNLVKGYNIDKVLSILIKNKLPNTKTEKRK